MSAINKRHAQDPKHNRFAALATQRAPACGRRELNFFLSITSRQGHI